MTRFKTQALASVSALVAASAMGLSAHAATSINGGGSTLLAPYWEQAAKCYDSDTSTIVTSTATIAAGNSAYLAKGLPVTSKAANSTTVKCSPTTGTIVQYDATGSGTGQAGVLSHDSVIQDPTVGLMFGSKDSSGTQSLFPNNIQYGLSDNSLVQTDLVTYDVGTGNSETLSFNGDSGTFTAPAAYQGLTFTGTTHPNATTYPVTKPKYGALVQFPVSVDPVALSYNPTYGSGSTFNVQAASKDANGGLALDGTTYCKIFTGAITNWNDAALTALNNNVSLTGGTSVPIKLIGRSDSSGTTSILTRHLAAICGSSLYTAGTTTLPSAVQSMFTLVSGSGGVANAINTTSGALGYIGADYVSPASANTGATPGFTLLQAALKDNAGKFEEANGTTALAAFTSLTPPQSTATGAYNSAVTTSDRRDPTQWVQSTAATAPLAKPTASGAYPIVGTTNFIGYTCYASSASITALEGFLNFGAGATGKTILSNASLSQLPKAWLTAITNTFFTSTGDAKALNLFLAPAGSSSVNSLCKASTIVGG